MAGSVGLILLFMWFLALERSGREVAVVGTILTVVVVEAALYPGFVVPTGIFHPQVGSTSFRPHEVLIAVALAARLAAKGLPQRTTSWSLCWVGFLCWVLVEGVIGLYVGHSVESVTVQAKVMVYLGAMALMAAVPTEDLLHGRTLPRLIGFAAVTACVMIVLDNSGFRTDRSLPGVPLEEFGRVGSDFSSICLAFGTVALGLSLARRRGQTAMLMAAAVLLLTTFAPSQRAVLISFLVLLVLGPLALIFRAGGRSVQVSSAEFALAGMMVITVLCVPWVIRATGGTSPSVFLTARVTTAFTDPGKVQSAQDRILQYQEVWPLIKDQPILGWGLGKTLTHFRPGPNVFFVSNYTHNIFTDLQLRTGLVGLGLFCAAIAVSLVAGVRTWRNHPDDEVAYLALACVIVIVGLLGKGSVESILEKFRLAVLLGVFLGMLRSLVISGAPIRTAASGDLRVAR